MFKGAVDGRCRRRRHGRRRRWQCAGVTQLLCAGVYARSLSFVVFQRLLAVFWCDR